MKRSSLENGINNVFTIIAAFLVGKLAISNSQLGILYT